MSELETVRNNILNELRIASNTESSINRIGKVQKQTDDLPSVLDNETLTKLRNGEYDISLKEYTTLSAYRTAINSLYGDSSTNKFQNFVNKTVNNNDNNISTTKDFINKMKENGMSNKQALKLYSALKSYSIITDLKNYNYISAKI